LATHHVSCVMQVCNLQGDKIAVTGSGLIMDSIYIAISQLWYLTLRENSFNSMVMTYNHCPFYKHLLYVPLQIMSSYHRPSIVRVCLNTMHTLSITTLIQRLILEHSMRVEFPCQS
jgi:hypothetical protein